MQQVLHPVDVIAMHSADGKIRPIRFRIENEQQECLRVDIEEVIKTTEIGYVGAEATIFLCRVRVGCINRILELKYKFRNHSWYLLK